MRVLATILTYSIRNSTINTKNMLKLRAPQSSMWADCRSSIKNSYHIENMRDVKRNKNCHWGRTVQRQGENGPTKHPSYMKRNHRPTVLFSVALCLTCTYITYQQTRQQTEKCKYFRSFTVVPTPPPNTTQFDLFHPTNRKLVRSVNSVL